MKVTLYIDGEHNTVEVKDKIKSVIPDANYMIFGVEDENALTIIKKQEAEIERLSAESFEHNVTKLFDKYKAHIKSETIKEFAERLKALDRLDVDVSYGYGREHYTEAIAVNLIDNLVKEMDGEE